jgi:hypothetical protein
MLSNALSIFSSVSIILSKVSWLAVPQRQEGDYHVVNPLQRFLSWSAIIGGTMKRIKTEYLVGAG